MDYFNPQLYTDARPLIRDGDPILWRIDRQQWTKPSNLLIARIGGSDYVHAGMAVWRGDELNLVHTRQWRGGHEVPLEKVVRGWPGQWDVFRPHQPYDSRKAADEMVKVIGRKYGWGNLFLSALRHTWITSRFLPPLTDDSLNGSAPFCSQAVSHACWAGGRDPRPNAADIATEPGHLADPTFAEYLFTLYWNRLPEAGR